MKEERKKTKYDLEYAKKHIKRVPLDMQIDAYKELQAAADRMGEKVNTYIKKAIEERMKREGCPPGDGFGVLQPSSETK